MSERRLFVTIDPNPKAPELTLVSILSKRMTGISIATQPPNEDNFYMGAFQIMVEEDQSEAVKTTWEKVTSTADFMYLQKASAGDVEFFRGLEMSSNDVIISKDEPSFMRFNRFLTRYAYHQAMEYAQLVEDPNQLLQLKLDFRKTWLPPFSPLQKKLLPHYLHSLVDRMHNLVTSAEERKTAKEWVLDWMMG